MDHLAVKRKPVRMLFTKSYNQLIEALSSDDVNKEEVKLKSSKLERVFNELTIVDNQICELLIDDSADSYEREYEAVEEYREKMDRARLRVETFFSQVRHQDSVTGMSCTPSSSCNSLRLPKIELKKFGGEVKEWLGFWSLFKRIHENEELSNEIKFQYLIQSTVEESRAREIVDSFPPIAKNYEKAIDCLRTRFGRDELLTEFYIRELLALVLKNNSDQRLKVNTLKLYDKLESYLRALESIGMTTEKYAAMLFPLVESCIPEDTLRVWLRSVAAKELVENQNDSYEFKLQQLLLFLKSEVEGEERIAIAKAGFKDEENYLPSMLPTARDLFSAGSQNSQAKCIFCEKYHDSKDCFSAQDMTIEKKKEILSNKRACFVCYKVGHRGKECKLRVKCVICQKRHFCIMCPDLEHNRRTAVSREQLQPDEKGISSVYASNHCSSQEVLLQTLLVRLKGSNGIGRVVRVLIDSGSQRSYILKKTIEGMGYTTLGKETLVHDLFGGAKSNDVVHDCYEVQVENLTRSYSTKISVLDQEVICSTIPRIDKGPWMEELKSNYIQLLDYGKGSPEIEMLIGADFLGNIITGNIFKLQCGLLAMETFLGWTVMGKVQRVKGYGYSGTMISLFSQSRNIADLWKLEAIGITDPCEKRNDQEMELAVQEQFEKTLEITPSGRYEVSLPWLRDSEDLKNNKENAEKRLLTTTLKLNSVNKFEDYDTVIKDWCKQGIVEPLSEGEEDKGHYLPHKAVFKVNSTTMVRPVFDASFHTKGSPSLNDCLAKGPNLLELIPRVLLRFREKKIGVISDIKQAFLQILVNERDCDFLKFLWWKDYSKKKIQIYRHRRVVFGVTCSPFLLGAVINYHLDKSQHHFKNLACKLKKAFYVDNCVTSVDSEEELKQFVSEATQLMQEGKFLLRGWESSYLLLEAEPTETTSVLGLLWDKSEDVLYCKVDDISTPREKLTRRNILAVAQQVFDPVGFTCPLTLIPKLLLQESWKKKLSWDSEITGDQETSFKKWMADLPLLSEVRIPRYVGLSTKKSVSLHTFCDASRYAYAAVVYLRSEEKNVVVELLQAKSRVSPLKSTTIPRLELLACLIGVRIAALVKEGLGLKDVPEYYWSDSSTALSWIKRNDQWSVFVSNRVKEILSTTNSTDWHHVPGHMNPADLPSRGCSVAKLKESRWWEGPAWLKNKCDDWPAVEVNIDEDEIKREMRRTLVTTVNSNDTRATRWYMIYFSSYTKILRMISWILRFVKNARSVECRQEGELTSDELNSSELKLLRLVQQEAFDSDGKDLKSLCVTKDRHGVLRVVTKITRGKFEEDFMYPIVLPRKHKLVELLIYEEHIKLSHAGIHVLITQLRQRFWILKARKTIRRVISKCVRCKRFKGKPIHTSPVPLPEDRIREAMIFEVIGVDLAGPLNLRCGRKAWVLLVTCAVYRAVHLELLASLSTNDFLMGFRRFVSRRGRPKVVYSDNGTNFVGTWNKLRELDWNVIQRESSAWRIQWRFSPPSAPWWGGWWERLIQMLKKLLRCVLGNCSLHYDEMQSILCDCEAVINSRPLTCLKVDSDEYIPLTPAMYMQDNVMVGVPDLDKLDEVNLVKRFQYIQHIREDLRQRFKAEYLSQLLQNPSKADHQEIHVGDIVLVGSESKKRINWPMAKVIKLYPGKDGKTRVVQLKTSSGYIIRPVQRLFPLEVTDPAGCPVPAVCAAVEEESDPANPELPARKVVTRSGREVKLPAKFM